MKYIKEDKNFIFDVEKKICFKEKIKRFLSFCLSVIYKMKSNIFYPHKKNEKKYNVSICAIFKNESQYLKEWIEYHKIIGVNHFYLYNNNSTDNFKKVLDTYIEEGLVDLIDWPKNQAQMECYHNCITRFKDESQWIGFIDIDEFINLIKYDNIYDFLKKFQKNRGSVLIYWKIFGSSGLIDRNRKNLVCEDFTSCWPKHDSIGKCFYNTNYDFNVNDKRNKILHHILWTSYKGMRFPPVNSFNKICINNIHKAKKTFDIQINHYFTKSYQEYLDKKSKGDVYFKINPHDEEYFFEHESKCTSADTSIYRFLIKLKKEYYKEDLKNGE